MTMGILEQISADIQANTAALNRIAAAQGGPTGGAPAGATTMGTAAAVQPAPTGITPEAITALITPHVSNPTLKEAFGTAMRAMGINALPEVQPHQYGPLYAAFQQIIAGAQTAGANTSII